MQPTVGKGERQRRIEQAFEDADAKYKSHFLASKGLARISNKLPISWARSLFKVLRRHKSKLFYGVVKQSLHITSSKKPLVTRFAMNMTPDGFQQPPTITEYLKNLCYDNTRIRPQIVQGRHMVYFTTEEVQTAFNRLSRNKATGMDHLSDKLLRMHRDAVSPKLA